MSHLENRRKYESEGLKDGKSPLFSSLDQEGDVIWVRVRPEHTTDKESCCRKTPATLEIKFQSLMTSLFLIITLQRSIVPIMEKTWHPMSDFITINENSISENPEKNILLVSNFIEKHGKIF